MDVSHDRNVWVQPYIDIVRQLIALIDTFVLRLRHGLDIRLLSTVNYIRLVFYRHQIILDRFVRSMVTHTLHDIDWMFPMWKQLWSHLNICIRFHFLPSMYSGGFPDVQKEVIELLFQSIPTNQSIDTSEEYKMLQRQIALLTEKMKRLYNDHYDPNFINDWTRESQDQGEVNCSIQFGLPEYPTNTSTIRMTNGNNKWWIIDPKQGREERQEREEREDISLDQFQSYISLKNFNDEKKEMEHLRREYAIDDIQDLPRKNQLPVANPPLPYTKVDIEWTRTGSPDHEKSIVWVRPHETIPTDRKYFRQRMTYSTSYRESDDQKSDVSSSSSS